MEEADFQMIADVVLKSIPAGAATSVYAATAPELEDQGGLYLYDCQVAPVDETGEVLDAVKAYAVEPSLAQTLWARSEAMVEAAASS
jgi:hypothetical protein